MDKFEKDLLNKIDSGVKLDEKEIRELVFECDYETKEHDKHRWTQSMETISKLGDRYFRTYWFSGLTEYQNNEFYNQPEEVIPHSYTETIVVNVWIKKSEV